MLIVHPARLSPGRQSLSAADDAAGVSSTTSFSFQSISVGTTNGCAPTVTVNQYSRAGAAAGLAGCAPALGSHCLGLGDANLDVINSGSSTPANVVANITSQVLLSLLR